jgi:hypothetical protein
MRQVGIPVGWYIQSDPSHHLQCSCGYGKFGPEQQSRGKIEPNLRKRRTVKNKWYQNGISPMVVKTRKRKEESKSPPPTPNPPSFVDSHQANDTRGACEALDRLCLGVLIAWHETHAPLNGRAGGSPRTSSLGVDLDRFEEPY